MVPEVSRSADLNQYGLPYPCIHLLFLMDIDGDGMLVVSLPPISSNFYLLSGSPFHSSSSLALAEAGAYFAWTASPGRWFRSPTASESEDFHWSIPWRFGTRRFGTRSLHHLMLTYQDTLGLQVLIYQSSFCDINESFIRSVDWPSSV